jgi:hypothetical protein
MYFQSEQNFSLNKSFVCISQQIALNGSKEHITSKHGLFEQERTPYTVTSCIFEQSLVMHPDFRLWLITVPDIGTPLPAVAVRYGIKLAWDDKLSYETSVRQSFLTLWNKHTHSDRTFKQLQLCDVQVNCADWLSAVSLLSRNLCH